MSTTTRLSLVASCLAALLFAGPILADDDRVVEEEIRTTTTTTTNSEGTVSQVSPGRIVIRTTQSPDPVTYTQTKTTTYVDEMGNPVAIETVRTGMPVKVFYDESGGEMKATRVVVQKRKVIQED
jgi:hypothetical protein